MSRPPATLSGFIPDREARWALYLHDADACLLEMIGNTRPLPAPASVPSIEGDDEMAPFSEEYDTLVMKTIQSLEE